MDGMVICVRSNGNAVKVRQMGYTFLIWYWRICIPSEDTSSVNEWIQAWREKSFFARLVDDTVAEE